MADSTTKTVAKRKTHAMVVSEGLNRRIGAIAEVLPAVLQGQADRLVKRAALTFAVATYPLNVCTPQSCVMAVIRAAEVGLPIDGKLAYAVPYKNHGLSKAQNRDVYEAVFQPSFVGLRLVAVRSGQISQVHSALVYEADDFQYGRNGNECYLRHSPIHNGDRGPLQGAYAVVSFPDGSWVVEFMDYLELMRIKSSSKAKRDDSPWQKHEGEMCRKTVIKRALKLYCSDPGFVLATQSDDVEYVDDPEVGRPVAGRRSGPSSQSVPGVYEPAPAAVTDDYEDFDWDTVDEASVSAPPEEESGVESTTTGSADAPGWKAGEIDDLLNQLSLRLDDCSSKEIDAAQRWGLENLPASAHGKVAEMCEARRKELG